MVRSALRAAAMVSLASFVGALPGGSNSSAAVVSGDAAKGEDAMQSATERLFDTLLVTFLAVFIGYAVVRLELVVPSRGDMKGMGFFVGQIAFPLLIFNTVATAKLGDVDPNVLLACTLGKTLVLVVTWTMTFVAYRPGRDRGQRFLTASVFAFYATASNDFAVGFPIVKALYGEQVNMGIYITGNALVGSLVFVPVIMVLFSIGKGMQANEAINEDSRTQERAGGCQQVFAVARDIFTNPVILMTFAGLLYKAIFGFTLVDEGMNLQLPSPLSDLVKLITSPFGMCALLMTGTNLKHFSIEIWSILLVMMKVVLCAYATYLFAGFFLGSDELHEEMRCTLQNFSFLYGMIPTSSAPLIFAEQFDPSSVDTVATAIALGLVVAGPMMFSSALFLEAGNINMATTLVQVQFTTAVTSLVCGGICVIMISVLRKSWDVAVPRRVLVLSYGVALIAYEALMVVMSPDVRPESCIAYNSSGGHSMTSFFLCWVQNASQLMIIMLQYLTVADKAAGRKYGARTPMVSLWVVALCVLFSILPAWLTIPNTITEMCSTVGEHQHIDVWPNAVKSYLLFLTMVVLGIRYVIVVRRGHRLEHTPMDGEGESGASSSEGSQDEGSEESNLEIQKEPDNSAGSLTKGVGRVLVFLQVILLFIRVVNISQVMSSRSIMGSFAQMLVVEGILEHSQLPILLGLMLSDRVFMGELRECLHQSGAFFWHTHHLGCSGEDSLPGERPLSLVRSASMAL